MVLIKIERQLNFTFDDLIILQIYSNNAHLPLDTSNDRIHNTTDGFPFLVWVFAVTFLNKDPGFADLVRSVLSDRIHQMI